MGWYDAFKGNTSRIDLSSASNNTGSAFKNFGDAFSNIGKTVLDVDTAREETALNELRMQNEKNRLADWKDEKTQKRFDDAFVTTVKSEDDLAAWQALPAVKTTDMDGNIVPTTPSPDAIKEREEYLKTKKAEDQKTIDEEFLQSIYQNGGMADKDAMQAFIEQKKPSAAAIKTARDSYQTLFNSDALENAVAGGYKDFATYKAANETLVANADGATLKLIDDYFSGKDNALAKLEAKKKELDWQKKLNDAKGKDEFKVDSSGIRSAAKIALGYDETMPKDFFTADKQKAFTDLVAGAELLARKHRLDSGLAVDFYMNPDKYDVSNGSIIEKKTIPQHEEDKAKAFFAIGGSLQKPQPEEVKKEPEENKQLWKLYKPD